MPLNNELDLYGTASGFKGVFETDMECKQELFYSDTWFRLFTGLANAPIVDTLFPKLVVIFPILHLDYLSVFLDCVCRSGMILRRISFL